MFIVKLQPAAFEDGAGVEQVFKSQEAQHFFGASRPGRGQMENHFQHNGISRSAMLVNEQINEERAHIDSACSLARVRSMAIDPAFAGDEDVG
ncbi:MAG: hypothetical protein ACREFZ_11205, partial [Acetobacteraceae bacterium]